MMDLPIAILAGGLATRLRPITQKIPKSLVDVAGEPFLAHQLRLLRSHGIRRAVLCVGHLGEMIERDFGGGSAFGVELKYSFDGPVLLGTGGALQQALPLLGNAFFVLYGDSYLPVDYAAVEAAWRAGGKDALMTVFRNEGAWDTSNVEFSAGEIARYDKQNRTPAMRHIDYGLSIFTTKAFADRADGERFDLSDLQRDLVAQGRMAGYEVRQRFYEVGSHAGLAELNELLSKKTMSYSKQHIGEAISILGQLNLETIEKMVALLAATRERGGRLFILGVGGSAGNASHAVNDFRKICGFEAYAPTDNVSELTARTNDEGWSTVFAEWLRGSRLRKEDALLVLSVGGGSLEKNVSPNLVEALKLAKERGATVLGIVGKDGGYTAQVADACCVVPTVNPATITPHSEAFQAVVWHLLVSHPALKVKETKWESTK
jgi:D-sedoheptulose 7-phosphate isomerase